RVWADALRDEYQAIAQYNSAMAAFEFSKGTIMQHDNVVIGEGNLPKCAMQRAVEHERERSKALVLHERPVGIRPCGDNVELGQPDLPHDAVPSVPAMFGQGPSKQWPEVKEPNFNTPTVGKFEMPVPPKLDVAPPAKTLPTVKVPT